MSDRTSECPGDLQKGSEAEDFTDRGWWWWAAMAPDNGNLRAGIGRPHANCVLYPWQDKGESESP